MKEKKETPEKKDKLAEALRQNLLRRKSSAKEHADIETGQRTNKED